MLPQKAQAQPAEHWSQQPARRCPPAIERTCVTAAAWFEAHARWHACSCRLVACAMRAAFAVVRRAAQTREALGSVALSRWKMACNRRASGTSFSSVPVRTRGRRRHTSMHGSTAVAARALLAGCRLPEQAAAHGFRKHRMRPSELSRQNRRGWHSHAAAEAVAEATALAPCAAGRCMRLCMAAVLSPLGRC